MARLADHIPSRLLYTACVLALACLWLAMLLSGGGALDRSLEQALYAGGRPPLILVARIFTFLGEPTVLVGAGFAVAAWLWYRRRGRFALALLLVILVGRGLTEVQKFAIARGRPTIEPHLVAVKTYSFPSGHATSSMIFYLTLALALSPPPSRRIFAAGAILLSLAIGVSRVMLGVHWPSDVVGGWSFGLLWVLVALPPAERLFGANSRTALEQL